MTGVTRFSLAALPVTNWKNGAGRTLELARWPEHASADEFVWRVSIATIEESGLFSVYPDIDRLILLLEGDGVLLEGTQISHRLDEVLQPFAFSGDAVIKATMLGASSRDFNVMTRRGWLHAQLRILDGTCTLPAARYGLCLALSGRWRVHDEVCETGHGLWWAETALTMDLSCQGKSSRLVAVIWE